MFHHGGQCVAGASRQRGTLLHVSRQGRVASGRLAVDLLIAAAILVGRKPAPALAARIRLEGPVIIMAALHITRGGRGWRLHVLAQLAGCLSRPPARGVSVSVGVGVGVHLE